MQIRLRISTAVMVLLFGSAGAGFTFGAREDGARNVRGFDRISLETAGRLYLFQGDEEYLTIDAPPNIAQRIITEVVGDTLHIRYRGWFSGMGAEPVFKLGIKKVRGIKALSSGHIKSKDIIAEDLDIEASSSGNIIVESLTARNLRLRISSSGDVTIANGMFTNIDANLSASGNFRAAGMAKSLILSCSSSGEFDGANLKTSTASVTLSSSGNAVIWVVDRLDANLSSSGNLNYYGEPKIGALKTSSSGAINHRGNK